MNNLHKKCIIGPMLLGRHMCGREGEKTSKDWSQKHLKHQKISNICVTSKNSTNIGSKTEIKQEKKYFYETLIEIEAVECI